MVLAEFTSVTRLDDIQFSNFTTFGHLVRALLSFSTLICDSVSWVEGNFHLRCLTAHSNLTYLDVKLLGTYWRCGGLITAYWQIIRSCRGFTSSSHNWLG
ncbi:hypothetical protein AcW1_009243 [Taiwanofungus camphoratus]|nr:hypothetical protein AcV5_007267 [Antrodia cinnamomea]KAI0949717.1 hypothetical protein AcW1_009243 [Antrodia cinnamomea]